MLAKTPPMGWNSWTTFGHNISDALIRETADAMVDKGYLDAGYNYLVIDDCWSERERDENGRLVPSREKFPNGMKAVADYVHSKGLKFGMYSDTGTRTCAGYPGSFEYEYVDARTFAEWGVDFLKYDYCNRPVNSDGKYLYRRMAMALRSTGREILLSACNWGLDDVYDWIRSSGAHMFRSTGDITDNWQSIVDLYTSQISKGPYGAPGCYNDIDMLVVGMNGKGNVARGGCSYTEYETHFALWCMMNSPLMIGCDIRNASEETRSILLNKDLIAINQDEDGRQPYLALDFYGRHTLVKPLANGEYAIGYFNLTDTRTDALLHFWDIGLPVSSGCALELYDCIKHEPAGTYINYFNPMLDPHQCAVYRAKVVTIK